MSIAQIDWLSFFESALANTVGTLIGVGAGVPIALYLTKKQERSQENAELRRRESARQEQLQALRSAIREEISHNVEQMRRLHSVLSETGHARTDQWQWADRVVSSFEFTIMRQLESMALSDTERLQSAPLNLAYRNLQRLKNGVHQAVAAHDFFLGYSANQSATDALLIEFRVGAENIMKQLAQATSSFPGKNEP
jgi:sensor domain CHASE-containing protein